VKIILSLENLVQAWSLRQSEEQKALWYLNRSTPVFIYNATDLTFIKIIYGYEKLANFLGVHINTAKRIAKSGNIYKNSKSDKFIISLVVLTGKDLETITIK